MEQAGLHCRKGKCALHAILTAVGNVKTVEAWAVLMLKETLPLSPATIDGFEQNPKGL